MIFQVILFMSCVNQKNNLDVWSNIYFGFVGKYCGFSDSFLLLGSNAQQMCYQQNVIISKWK